MSSLITGVVLIALSVLVFLVVYRCCRGGAAGGCFSDSWVANLHAPLMVGLLTFGSGYLVKFALTAMP